MHEPLTAADRFQIELLRRATPQRRSQLAAGLSRDVILMARRAIAAAFPDLDEWQRGVKFVEVHYGRALAERVHADLIRRGLLRRDG